MENKKYKIVVFSDLKNSNCSELKSAISLAKLINGEIELFYVKKPIQVVESDNQLSAMRTINSEYTDIKKQLNELVEPLITEYKFPIRSSFVIGNVKTELDAYVKKHNPDIIVLGRRKSKFLNLGGDSITEYILANFNGTVMISSDKNSLEPNKELSLGLLNDTEHLNAISFAEDLLKHTQKPLKTFKVLKKSDTVFEEKKSTDIKTVDYVFDENDESIKNLSNYILKNNINLLYFNSGKNNMKKGVSLPITSVRDMVSKLNVSLLLAG